jgi:hypothetical protein
MAASAVISVIAGAIVLYAGRRIGHDQILSGQHSDHDAAHESA